MKKRGKSKYGATRKNAKRTKKLAAQLTPYDGKVVEDVENDTDWAHLVRIGIEERDKYLTHVTRLVEQYVGTFYKDGKASEGVLANHPAELIAILIPQLASSIPYIKVSAQEIGVDPNEVYARQGQLNKWAKATDFRKLQEELATAYCFLNHIWYVGMEKKFADEAESGDPALMPVGRAIDWSDFVFDACAKKVDSAFFRGHRERTTRRELLKRAEDHPEEGWDADAIRSIGAARYEEGANRWVDASRDEVEFWQIWVPSLRNDEGKYPQEGGYHGKILTVTTEQLGGPSRTHFLRKPFAFFGPRWGPYGVTGAYVVPGEPIELSPLISDALQAEALNDVDQAITKSDYQYRRFIATQGNRTDVNDLLAAIEHDGIANFPGSEDLSKHMAQIEIFGSTRWMHATRQSRREALDRKSGLFQAMLGNTTSGATATADTIADRASSTRFSHHVTKNAASFTQLLRTVLWYMLADEDISEKVAPEALHGMVDQFGQPLREEDIDSMEIRGGDEDWVDESDRFAVTIDIGSAALTAEQRAAKELQGLQFFVEMQGVLAQMPAMDGERTNRLIADIFNMPVLVSLSKIGEAQKIAAMRELALNGGNGQQNGASGHAPQASMPQAGPTRMETRMNVSTPPTTAPANKPKNFPQYGTSGKPAAESHA